MAKTMESSDLTGVRDLEHLFNPSSIAFIGATETPSKWGFIVFNNLLMGGYEGQIYPVNPSRETIMGRRAYPSVSDIPGDVEMAIFTIPAREVPGAMRACVDKGVKAALVISAGFKELGERGAALENEMVETARKGGIVLAGPNGQGIACPSNGLFAWMPMLYPMPGRIAAVSQSGNILSMLVGHLNHYGYGVSKAVSSGNEADLRIEDYLEHFAHDPDTDVIVAYIEGIPDGRRFFETARRISSLKPIVVVKGGRTNSGVEAARSHTGALAVSEEMFEAACRQAGVVRAATVEEAGALAAAFMNRPLPGGRRVGIVTGGGGLGVIASDACTDEGLKVATLTKETLEEIQGYLPDWWVPGNPIDLVAGLDLTIIPPVIETLTKSGEVDSVFFIFVTSPRDVTLDPPYVERGVDIRAAWDVVHKAMVARFNELQTYVRSAGIPLYVISNLSAREIAGDPEARLDGSHTAVFSTVEMGCRAISEMARYGASLRGIVT